MMRSLFLLAMLPLAACQSAIQTTSGQEYVARYDSAHTNGELRNIDAEIRDIALVEPDLRFPARIGIARIGIPTRYGSPGLTSIPIEEVEAWASAAEELGTGYGEFLPISPLVMAMVATPAARNEPPANVVQNIRRAAARQHVDYVLVYEVGGTHRSDSNALSIADWTIIGLPFVPSRNISADAVANAVLIDVRNGYPYGMASSVGQHQELGTAISSGYVRQREVLSNAEHQAVAELASEVTTMMQELRNAMAEQAEAVD